MKETKSLEEQLRSWKPRRPSARLERRIFGDEPAAKDLRGMFRVLLPAAACLILTVAMLTQPEHGDTNQASPGRLVVTSLSNQNFAAYLPGSFTCEANRLDTFGWTNGGAFPSSTGSISPGKAKH